MPTEDADGSQARATLLAGLRGWLHDSVELVRVRVELLGLEAGEHARGVAELVAFGVAAAILFSLGLGFLAVLFTVVLWDSHRTLALALFAGVFLSLGGVTGWLAWLRVRQTRRWFEATAQELSKDAQALKP